MMLGAGRDEPSSILMRVVVYLLYIITARNGFSEGMFVAGIAFKHAILSFDANKYV